MSGLGERPPLFSKITKSGKHYGCGPHTLNTEARSLEEACDIIHAKQIAAKVSEKQKGKKITLKQLFAFGNNRANHVKGRGEVSLPGGGHNKRIYPEKTKLPHPFRDLLPEQKRSKAREMFESGCWGFKERATNHLARAFNVTKVQMAEWLA